jgi:hypothetical protein
MKAGSIAGIIIVGGLAAAVMRELPEVRRYLKISSM